MPHSPPRHKTNATKKEAALSRKENNRRYNKKSRTGQEFYNSGRWRNLRNWFIKNNPLCIKCKGDGYINMADIVDHIIPIKNGGDKLNANNLQSLCISHHNQKTAEDRTEAVIQP